MIAKTCMTCLRGKVFSFDERLHDGAALFLYRSDSAFKSSRLFSVGAADVAPRCLRRLGGSGILNFLQLEVDAAKAAIVCCLCDGNMNIL